MKLDFVPFDDIWPRVRTVLEQPDVLSEDVRPVYLVRDLFGKIRVSVPDRFAGDEFRGTLQSFATRLHQELGAHCYPPHRAVLYVNDSLLNGLKRTARQIAGFSGVYRADRLITGSGWWTVDEFSKPRVVKRCTLYSVKGGVGRSTTATVLAWYLARNGERVLAVDLDLESPGLSSALLEPERRPQFGIADWFVEDLVGQGDRAMDEMLAAPAWMQDLEGDVRVVPAHGAKPGEYLAKLGRVYMNKENSQWTERLKHLLDGLEGRFQPTTVLLESRSGLHDIAAATVTDVDAEVLLFASDSDSTWTDYKILFRHWNEQGLAKQIRERLSIVSALTPARDREAYVGRFRSRAWDLFLEHLYDELDGRDDPGDIFSFDMDDTSAPHSPLEINWTVDLAAGSSLRKLNDATVEAAYGRFLRPFSERILPNGRADAP